MPAPSKSLRVAIADDHALFRQGLRSLLGMTNDVSVVAETDRAEAILPMLSATSRALTRDRRRAGQHGGHR